MSETSFDERVGKYILILNGLPPKIDFHFSKSGSKKVSTLYYCGFKTGWLGKFGLGVVCKIILGPFLKWIYPVRPHGTPYYSP